MKICKIEGCENIKYHGYRLCLSHYRVKKKLYDKKRNTEKKDIIKLKRDIHRSLPSTKQKRSEYGKIYHILNKDKLNKKSKDWYKNNQSYVKRYRLKNSGKRSCYNKKWRRENTLHRQQYARQYHKDHNVEIRLRNKQYKKDHPEIQLKSNKKQLEKMGNLFNISSTQYKYAIMSWSKTVKKLGNGCAYCGNVYDLHSHHIFSKSKHPSLSLNTYNGIILCKKCHIVLHSLNGCL